MAKRKVVAVDAVVEPVVAVVAVEAVQTVTLTDLLKPTSLDGRIVRRKLRADWRKAEGATITDHTYKSSWVFVVGSPSHQKVTAIIAAMQAGEAKASPTAANPPSNPTA